VQSRIQEDIESAQRSGVRVTPTFFINGRRYRGTWDESSLADAMLGSLGHRIQSAAFEFVRWGPSSGVAFPDSADYAAAKIAIFLASLIAGGVLILWPKENGADELAAAAPNEIR
jgi:NhaA family Na+:H+ antiporter